MFAKTICILFHIAIYCTVLVLELVLNTSVLAFGLCLDNGFVLVLKQQILALVLVLLTQVLVYSLGLATLLLVSLEVQDYLPLDS